MTIKVNECNRDVTTDVFLALRLRHPQVKSCDMEVLRESVTGHEQSPGRLQVKASSALRNAVRYGLHLAAIYAIVQLLTMRLAGLMHGTILPFLQDHPLTVSVFQFAFSHLFAFSFLPALILGFLYSEWWFRHREALFVWIVPVAILFYKFATFPATVFQDHFAAAFHEYFGGGFVIPEFHSYEELFQLIGPNPDAMRGMEQWRYTAPVYAAIGYAIGTWVAIRFRIPRLERALSYIKPSLRPPKIE